MPIPPLPLFRHRDTVVTPADQNQFVTQFENTMDTMSNDVIPALNLAITDINEKVITTTTARDESVSAKNISVAAKDEALTAVATLQEGAIDDTTIAPNKAFSNSYIKTNYYDKTEVDTAINNSSQINPLPDKSTPVDTDNLALQEVGGLLKKLSFANLKLSLFNPTLTANATLTGSDNKIVMNGIVTALGLEVGDVIKFTSVANANNQKIRTVESIVNNNEIIVNYEHCGSRGNGSLKLTDEALTNATITRIAKWFSAPLGLGQAPVIITRSNNITYSYIPTRTMSVYFMMSALDTKAFVVKDGVNYQVGRSYFTVGSQLSQIHFILPSGFSFISQDFASNPSVEVR